MTDRQFVKIVFFHSLKKKDIKLGNNIIDKLKILIPII
jgi:hypothetical protein